MSGYRDYQRSARITGTQEAPGKFSEETRFLVFVVSFDRLTRGREIHGRAPRTRESPTSPSKSPLSRDTSCSRIVRALDVITRAALFRFFPSRVREISRRSSTGEISSSAKKKRASARGKRSATNPKYVRLCRRGYTGCSRNIVSGIPFHLPAHFSFLSFVLGKEHEHPRTPLSARSPCTRVRNTAGHCSDASPRCVTSGRFIDAHRGAKEASVVSRGEEGL